jgi:hypothetical protein
MKILVCLPFILCVTASAARFPDLIIDRVDISTAAEKLPYKFESVISSNTCGKGPGEHVVDCAHIRDGINHNIIFYFNLYVNSGTFSSAVGCLASPYTGQALFQYNGPYQHCRIWDCHFLDIKGGPEDEVIMVKAEGDTVFFEIIVYGIPRAEGSMKGGDDAGSPEFRTIMDTIIFPAVVGTGLKKSGEWHTILAQPLAAVDFNGDGSRDLIYSRVSSPGASHS